MRYDEIKAKIRDNGFPLNPKFIMDKGVQRAYKELFGIDPVEGEFLRGMEIVFYKESSDE